MKNPMLEAGKIVNTHGVRGEVKVESWLDDPALFSYLTDLTVNGKVYPIRSARVQGRFALVTLEGVTSIDDALPLKGKTALARREEIPLEEGAHFVADLIGLDAVDADSGQVFGKVADVHEYPAQDVYEVRGERLYFIPDVPDFVEDIDEAAGCIRFRRVEELAQ
ncbi:MAG: ribosome maturation factor RimM [Clostridiales bacterium]|nr:ribosome maturation factor RimM [Clostridiales bacterium]